MAHFFSRRLPHGEYTIVLSLTLPKHCDSSGLWLDSNETSQWKAIVNLVTVNLLFGDANYQSQHISMQIEVSLVFIRALTFVPGSCLYLIFWVIRENFKFQTNRTDQFLGWNAQILWLVSVITFILTPFCTYNNNVTTKQTYSRIPQLFGTKVRYNRSNQTLSRLLQVADI